MKTGVSFNQSVHLMPRRKGKNRCDKFIGNRTKANGKIIGGTNSNPRHKASKSLRSNTNDSTYFIDTTGSTLHSTDHGDTTRIIMKHNSAPSNVRLPVECGHLPIPRRPKWDKKMRSKQLHEMESKHFILWRRHLSKRIESISHQFPNRLIEMSPFEKNLNLWRELWRVIERSHVIIVVVDARNPLAFIARDVLKYIEEIDKHKQCIIAINKADFLTTLQREKWLKYFQTQRLEIVFFSAISEQIKLGLTSKAKREEIKHLATESGHVSTSILEQPEQEKESENLSTAATNVSDHDNSKDVRILGRDELCNIFRSKRKEMALSEGIVIGFIGYPNVGKSSMINALIGRKKVAMGSLPGKTKRLQTLYVDEHRDEEAVILCDCPGIVFPSWSSSKAAMVLDGVIPIDHLRDLIKPIELMMSRVGMEQLNAVYAMNMKKIQKMNGYAFLEAFCIQRKMYCKDKGQRGDVMRAAKIILKDYVNGKLLYNHPPPSLLQKVV